MRRDRLAAARLVCERLGLGLVHPGRPAARGRILCYHSVGQPEFGVNDITAERFRRHIEIALATGYRFVPASLIADGHGGPNDLAVTFDDGARSVLTSAAPVLQDYGAPFTVFVVARWADEAKDDCPTLGWKGLERLLLAGAEIGSHSLTHPDFGLIGDELAAIELVESRSLIGARLGVCCDDFAIPFGGAWSWSARAAELAANAGYVRAYAQSEELRPPDTTPRSFVSRFDGDTNFRALLRGAYDAWQEWT